MLKLYEICCCTSGGKNLGVGGFCCAAGDKVTSPRRSSTYAHLAMDHPPMNGALTRCATSTTA